MTRYIIERKTHDRFAVLHEHGVFEVSRKQSKASRFVSQELAQFWLSTSELSRFVWNVKPVEGTDVLLA